ncbi:ABC transporter permease [Alloacidobacterium sp.]|uniref:ABC transporter permease n=1 Tax=Alloacidobacterium sp. TaxID=2951999 RepID=UPI002D6507E3|nr:ABC transporter permease [Alloacidobacterium sp.]HYK37145.1 ABC transporter permease [Alloacidobacterium sp.]
MHTMLRDLRYALRQLFKSPGFALTAILTLALGVGANTAIFSVIYGLLLRTLPFHDAGRLVAILETHPQVPGGAEATYPDYLDWRGQQKSFEQVAAYSVVNPGTVSLVTGGESEQVHRVLASGNFFSVLGVSPLLGRLLNEQDEKAGSDHVAVLSTTAWRRYFGGEANVVGRSIDLNGTSYTVIGVLPSGATYPAEGEVWLPLSLLDQPTQASRVWHSVNVLGRLKGGVSLADAKTDMQTIAARISAAYPATNRLEGVALKPLREQLIGTLRPAILCLMGAVLLVLLIACANVANLILVRATANQREVAIRQALGADRARLFSQFLTQTMILCLMGGWLGTALAWLALPLLRLALSHTAGVDLALVQTIGLNIPVLLLTLSSCVLTAMVFGLLPVTKTFSSLAEAFRPGDRASAGGNQRSRGVLISGEIAIAVIVLFLGTLVVRSFQKLVAVDPGFRIDHLLSFEMTLPEPRYSDSSPAATQFYELLLDKIRQMPGVISAGSTTAVPLNPSLLMTRFLIEGAPPLAPGSFPYAQIRYVSPDFFRTMGVGLRQGRVFDKKDVDSPTGFFVVNQTFAQKHLAGRDPIGAHILIGVMSPQPSSIPVIGVVANARDLGVETEPQPEIYLPGYGLHAVLLVRTGASPESIVPQVRNAVHKLDPNLAIYNVQAVDDVLSDSLARQKMTAVLLGIFAIVAVALAAIGIYGVLAYSVEQRTREIGVRMAVGARREDILSLVLKQASMFVAAGIVVGLAVGFAGARLLSGLLFKTSTADPLSVSVTIGALVIIAALAVSLPARRAASVEPTEALRTE